MVSQTTQSAVALGTTSEPSLRGQSRQQLMKFHYINSTFPFFFVNQVVYDTKH